MSAWKCYLIKDIDTLKLVQIRATKREPGLRHVAYEERLERLNLITYTAVQISQ